MILLNHSDCDGKIESKDCGLLADDLESILGKLDQPEWSDYGGAPPSARVGGGLINLWRLNPSWVASVAQQFIKGLRAAAAAGEDVEFG